LKLEIIFGVGIQAPWALEDAKLRCRQRRFTEKRWLESLIHLIQSGQATSTLLRPADPTVNKPNERPETLCHAGQPHRCWIRTCVAALTSSSSTVQKKVVLSFLVVSAVASRGHVAVGPPKVLPALCPPEHILGAVLVLAAHRLIQDTARLRRAPPLGPLSHLARIPRPVRSRAFSSLAVEPLLIEARRCWFRL